MEESKDAPVPGKPIIIDETTTLMKNPEVTIREEMEEDGKYVLFNAENEIVLIINATGRFILEKCNGITVGQIVKEIEKAYNVLEGVYLLGVVKTFLATLIDAKLVKIQGE